MFDLFSKKRKVDGPANRRGRRLYLEELEPRDVPAPVLLPASQIATTIPATPLNAAQPLALSVAAATSFATASLTAGNPLTSAPALGSVTLGLPTVAVGSVTAAPYLFSTGPFTVPAGLPNPVRLTPTAALTVMADSSMPAIQPYITEDISLTGGGGLPVDDHVRPNDAGNPNNPQLRLEASALDLPDDGPPASPEVQDAALLLVSLSK
jgi:hypothetical protein